MQAGQYSAAGRLQFLHNCSKAAWRKERYLANGARGCYSGIASMLRQVGTVLIVGDIRIAWQGQSAAALSAAPGMSPLSPHQMRVAERNTPEPAYARLIGKSLREGLSLHKAYGKENELHSVKEGQGPGTRSRLKMCLLFNRAPPEKPHHGESAGGWACCGSLLAPPASTSGCGSGAPLLAKGLPGAPGGESRP